MSGTHDAAAEHDAADIRRSATRGDDAGGLPLRRRLVDLPLARDDEIGVAQLLIEPHRSSTVGAPGTSSAPRAAKAAPSPPAAPEPGSSA